MTKNNLWNVSLEDVTSLSRAYLLDIVVEDVGCNNQDGQDAAAVTKKDLNLHSLP